jgi:hypothetical protein
MDPWDKILAERTTEDIVETAKDNVASENICLSE